MAKRRGEEEQQREVSGWRASGLSAAAYAGRRGYSAASLSRWATMASGQERRSAEQRFVRLEVTPAEQRTAGVVLEVGAARVLVEPGFDGELLRAVVGALAGGAAK
jgi:hypothetical protein